MIARIMPAARAQPATLAGDGQPSPCLGRKRDSPALIPHDARAPARHPDGRRAALPRASTASGTARLNPALSPQPVAQPATLAGDGQPSPVPRPQAGQPALTPHYPPSLSPSPPPSRETDDRPQRLPDSLRETGLLRPHDAPRAASPALIPHGLEKRANPPPAPFQGAGSGPAAPPHFGRRGGLRPKQTP